MSSTTKKASRTLKPTAPRPRKPANVNGTKNGSTLEAHVVELARAGKLTPAARRAIDMQADRGIAITFKRGNVVVKRYPDGREKVLGRVAKSKFTLPKGVAIIGNR